MARDLGNEKHTQTPAGGSSAERSAADTATVRHATVVRYDPGKRLEVKVRDRTGQHVYDLSNNRFSADIPADLKQGAQVIVTENVDANGARSLKVQKEQ